MKKSSFLAGVTLLFASLFTTSCKEIMSNLDQPVSSYLELKTTTAAIAPGKTYQIEASTISTSTIDYESSNPNVAIVDPSGKITALEDGEATITVKVAANENYLAGSAQFNVKVQSPLTLEAKADGKINVYFNSVTLEEPIVYTIVGGKSKSITASEAIDVKKGQKVQFESKNDHLATGTWSFVGISPDVQCAVYGNVMSLITPEGDFNSNTTITKNWALSHLFYWSYNIVNHDKYKLVLPATTLSENCYYGMFERSALSEAPELPATNIPDNAYQLMFSGCNGLTEAPAITAEVVGKYGCSQMFCDCSKLAKANAISVKTAGQYAFESMFNSCVELTESPAISVKSLGDYGCYAMFFNNQKMTKAKPIYAEKTIGIYGLNWMFEQCVELTESPAITAETIGEYACQNMFSGCQKLKKANAIKVKTAGKYAFQNLFANQPELTDVVAVNAETMGEGACSYMFNNCPKLKNVPATLPAENLANRCYSDMFAGCTSLKKAPALPATDLKSYCYNYMFGGCSALTEAPELKAATLADNCYNNMFNGCSKLNKVVCLATTNATDALGYWLAGAGTDASVTKRTLVRAEANTNWTNNDGWSWGTANWYVPTGWTFDPEIPNE